MYGQLGSGLTVQEVEEYNRRVEKIMNTRLTDIPEEEEEE
jgi:hypothetical protein